MSQVDTITVIDPKRLLTEYRRHRRSPINYRPRFARISALVWASPTSTHLMSHTIKYKGYWLNSGKELE